MIIIERIRDLLKMRDFVALFIATCLCIEIKLYKIVKIEKSAQKAEKKNPKNAICDPPEGSILVNITRRIPIEIRAIEVKLKNQDLILSFSKFNLWKVLRTHQFLDFICDLVFICIKNFYNAFDII